MWLLLACVAPSSSPIPEPEETGVDPNARLEPPEYGAQLSIDPIEIPAFDERYWCKTMRLPNTEALDVVALQHRVTAGAHHYNVWGLLSGPEGVEGPCDEVWAGQNMSLGSPLYASQQPTFYGEFPEGVAAKLPGGLLTLQELHFINTTDQSITVTGEVNVIASPPGEDLIYANGIYGSIEPLDIAPHSETTFQENCKVDYDVNVFVLGSHFHSRGQKFDIRMLDEAGEPGDLVYESTDYESPLLKMMPDDPIPVKAGSGFNYACTFRNDSDSEIHASETSEGEMCMMVGIYYPDQGFLRCKQ
jgi:hypothetical protein